MKSLTLKYLALPALKLNTERIDFFLYALQKCHISQVNKSTEEKCFVVKELLPSKLSNSSY